MKSWRERRDDSSGKSNLCRLCDVADLDADLAEELLDVAFEDTPDRPLEETQRGRQVVRKPSLEEYDSR